MDTRQASNNTIPESACGSACACVGKESEVMQGTVETRALRTYLPAVDTLHMDDRICLVVDIPGVPEDGVDLRVEKNVLGLRAMPADGTIAGKRLAYAEYGMGEYRRSFVLPEGIDRDAITASLKNGVLRITLPKSAPTSKIIPISS